MGLSPPPHWHHHHHLLPQEGLVVEYVWGVARLILALIPM